MNPSCSVSRNRHTQSYFDWSVTRARKKIPGLFASEFWNKLVLQVSTQEDAVLYSLVALASAHKSGMLSPAGMPENENFTLQHYNAAIFQLQHHLVTGNKESIRIVTISCLIFICLEFMRSNIKTGADHLQNGLNLLPLFNSQSCLGDGALMLKAHNESIEDVITEAFLRIGQSRFFPTLAVRMLAISYSVTTTMLQKQRRIQKDLDCWLSLFKHSYEDIVIRDSEESLPLTLLRIHHATAYVMAGTCLAPSDELAYDLFKSSFDSVVSLSDHILEAAASVMAADICAEPALRSLASAPIWV
ncbi:hypothetical protein FPRO05_11192 [Fusarium proliferatum]|uniref:Transcription factor domain-containing protein n=1 Tax=Gibberella intermedia TaxID=948311 RepID=A0A365NBV4_GIBIN|nr:hypothetical protein FPRO05_11192 [Fusarium proliferatum]